MCGQNARDQFIPRMKRQWTARVLSIYVHSSWAEREAEKHCSEVMGIFCSHGSPMFNAAVHTCCMRESVRGFGRVTESLKSKTLESSICGMSIHADNGHLHALV